MIASLKLPLRFDVQQLNADLERIAPDEWVPHFNKGYYEGEWSGVALRSVRGATLSLYPDPNAQGSFADTDVLERCPYFRQVLAAFECELESVRLLRLRAGSQIREHRDYRLGLEDGVLRVHVPITTNPGVAFLLEGQPVPMAPGDAWYLDFNRKHSVANHGDTDRVHLVIDGIVNDWVRGLFPAA
jgi:hypothetical protein